MPIALTRDVSGAIGRCELTHLSRRPIDIGLARRQHEAYERALETLGCSVVRLEASDEMPDSVFIEDIALVFDELAIVTRPGAESRRVETSAVADALAAYRPVAAIESPGTVDGGDVLTVGRHVFVGQSSRTNAAALSQLAAYLTPRGYMVQPVEVGEVLHLKSAVTAVADGTLLVNPKWVAADRFKPFECIEIDPDEPYAANALRIGDSVVYPVSFPRTSARLEARGVRIVEVEVGELAKAEGAVTCCSLIFNP
jgi:dimethylargininase